MKKVSIVSLIALLAIVISSCGSSNNVVSNHGISKRKYNKGFFFQRKSNVKTAKTDVKEADLKEDKSIAKIEKAEARKAKKENVINTSVESSDMVNTSNHVIIMPVEEKEEVLETRQFLNKDLDGVDWEVTENRPSETGELIQEMPLSNRANSSKQESKDSRSSDIDIILLVILALIIPPLAVFLYEDASKRFWIDLVLALLGYGVGWALFGSLGALAGLTAVIYALLIVLEVI